jgi:hypothetical protein
VPAVQKAGARGRAGARLLNRHERLHDQPQLLPEEPLEPPLDEPLEPPIDDSLEPPPDEPLEPPFDAPL